MPDTKNQTTWKAWGDTDPGRQRGNNEDRIYCESERGIFIVADGIGGEAAGEVAAQNAVDFMKKRLGLETGTIARRLREAITGANNEIYRLSQAHPKWKGMACVLTASVIEDDALHIGHVGDSRLYKIRDGQIRKVTPDHSPIGKREDTGELTELEAMRHPRRNEVFRDIGSHLHKPDDEDFIEYLQVPFEMDSAFLLCSDGLSDMLTSAEILESVLANADDPRAGVRDLIAKANAAGGKDNISVILVEGDDFARAALGKSADLGAPIASGTHAHNPAIAGTGFGRIARLFAGRLALFFYGIVFGILLLTRIVPYFRGSSQDDGQPQQVSPAAKVLTVEPTSPEYPTITKALESARAGDRIEVGRGEYEESIRLKDGVDIAAISPGKVILHIVRALPGADAAIVAEGVSGANVTGIAVKAELTAGLPFGIRIADSNVTLSNLEVTGATQAGVSIDGRSNSTLAASYIHSNLGPGIVISGTSTSHLIGNVIHANGAAKEHLSPGLIVGEYANPEVTRNVFSGNGAEAIRLLRQDLRDRMMDNLFVGPGKSEKVVVVERARK